MTANIVPFPRRNANDNHISPEPPQPDLRAFIVYDRLPDDCTTHVVTNCDTMPLIRPGETLVIDPTDNVPAQGELFVIEYGAGTLYAQRYVVELWLRPGRYQSANGEFHEGVAWMAGAFARPRTADAQRAMMGSQTVTVMTEGPYATEGRGYEYLRSKIVGRVVGILETGFVEPLRIAA